MKVVQVSRERRKQADLQRYMRDVNAAVLLTSLRRNLKLIIAGSVTMAIGAFLIGYMLFSYSDFFSFDVVLRALSTSFIGLLVGFFIFSALIVLREERYGFVYLPAYETTHPAKIHNVDDHGDISPPTEENVPVRTAFKTEPSAINTQVNQLSVMPDMLSVHELAENIVDYPVARLIVISPEGAVASQRLVELVRLIASQSLNVLLIEMSGTVQNAEAMLGATDYAGITELLLGQNTFDEVVHQDNASQAQIMPLGKADPAIAMQNASKLPEILDRLSAAFDIIVIDCGAVLASDVEGIYSDKARILFSINSFADEQVTVTAHEFDKAGYQNVIILHG